MATVTINGITYTGNNIIVNNGTISVDGKDINKEYTGIVEVRIIEGVLNSLKSSASVSCGPVTGNIEAGGSVSCDSVGASIKASGSVNCDDVNGNITAGGSVNCGDVKGSVSAGGSVRHG